MSDQLYVVECQLAPQAKWRIYGGSSARVDAYPLKYMAEANAVAARKFNRSQKLDWRFRVRRYRP